ncbi:MAG: GTPase ObgE [Actinomycetota bacterium]|nr:GTPase ObgE [Actinomycetota bacterium]
MFHDRARIEVLAGRGGDGGLSFRREKHVPRGGPDGGDGGRGGDVVIVANKDLRDLSAFRQKTRFKAGRGEPGRGSRKHGADGATIVLEVPVGTQASTPEGDLISDLKTPGAQVVLARGGNGGRGNARFATPTRQTPRFAEVGDPPGEAEVELHLKLLADAALAGLPNAGKSSLLRRISNAKPKVAEYPFTTLAPVLGTVESPDGAQLTVADVPGLIEGASEGIGLGHEFLAHLERARVLLHVIDASEDDVEERFRTIDRELALYGAGLDERPQAIVLNKIDAVPGPPSFQVDDPRIVGVFHVSALTGAGIEQLKRRLFTLIPPIPPLPEAAEELELPEFLEYRPQPPARRAFRIYRTDRGFRVVGEAPQGEELEAALEAAGVRKGQDVELGDETLEWQ